MRKRKEEEAEKEVQKQSELPQSEMRLGVMGRLLLANFVGAKRRRCVLKQEG